MDRKRKRKIVTTLVAVELEKQRLCAPIMLVTVIYALTAWYYEKYYLKNCTFVRHETCLSVLDRFIGHSDITCVNELRMDRKTFGMLCELLRTHGRLKMYGLVAIEEQVCMFLYILAHHVKNRTVRDTFGRSGERVSRYFNSVLNAVLRLHEILLKVPDLVPNDCTEERWKWFKNCLGALDGTYIKVHVLDVDKPRYRTRKGDIATNVLGVCSRDMRFIFVLPGWEGSTSDSRVLRDAIYRPHGLKVPTRYYYLVDAGYTNCEGFLAPYRGTRYHLSEWREGCAPLNHREYFNMKHASARNVVERCFGLLKMCWAILRSPSFYPIQTQCLIIMGCCLLHNLIRREMSIDPMEQEIYYDPLIKNNIDHGTIDTIAASDQWSAWRDNLATEMFNEWMANRAT
ncbi:hypothetical protein CerSpe_168660 [Prunus speciosa]